MLPLLLMPLMNKDMRWLTFVHTDPKFLMLHMSDSCHSKDRGHISVGLTEVKMWIVLYIEWVINVFLYVWIVACEMMCVYVNMYVKGQVRENRLLVSVNSGFELDRHEGTLDVSFIKMAQKTMRRGNTDEKALQTI